MSWVERLRYLATLTDFLHDDEAVVSLGQSFDLEVFVPRNERETLTARTDVLVLIERDGERRDALDLAALAQRLESGRTERLGGLLDPLVRLAEERLVPRRPPRTHLSLFHHPIISLPLRPLIGHLVTPTADTEVNRPGEPPSER